MVSSIVPSRHAPRPDRHVLAPVCSAPFCLPSPLGGEGRKTAALPMRAGPIHKLQCDASVRKRFLLGEQVMRSILACGLVLGVVLVAGLRARVQQNRALEEEKRAKDAGEGQIAHMVYFTLKENSSDAKKKIVDVFKRY